MICPECKEAGDMIPALKAVEETKNPAMALLIREKIKEAHAKCRGNTWCDCQHL